jgi:hypothetical protein
VGGAHSPRCISFGIGSTSWPRNLFLEQTLEGYKLNNQKFLEVQKPFFQKGFWSPKAIWY